MSTPPPLRAGESQRPAEGMQEARHRYLWYTDAL